MARLLDYRGGPWDGKFLPGARYPDGIMTVIHADMDAAGNVVRRRATYRRTGWDRMALVGMESLPGDPLGLVDGEGI